MLRWALLLVVCVTGCKRPPEAPSELDELVGYLFEHVATEDPAYLEVGATNLDAWLDLRLEETVAGYQVNKLDAEGVTALGEGEQDLTDLAGAAVGAESVHGVEDLGVAIAVDDPTLMYPGTYLSFDREYDGDPDCFVSEECAFLAAETHGEMVYALGLQVETHSMVEWRWVETDFGRALVQRTWLREPATISLDFLSVEQQYYVWMFLPTDTGSRSIQATWVVATLTGSAVPEGVALDLVIGSMSKGAEDLDVWIDAKK